MTQHRDVVVIGASAGGLEALQRLVAALPSDLAAAVFVVVHQSADHRTQLPAILGRLGPLPVELAIHGHPIEPGRIVVAPPDNHLLLTRGGMSVVRGPKENGHRPAVDPLFRSAADAYGPRVVAVVLSGALDCGTAGLLRVKARGGLALVQEPDEAAYPSMPRSALEHVQVDHVALAAELGQLIGRIVSEPLLAGPVATPAPTEAPAPIVCPACQGAMVEVQEGGFPQVRCHTGHVFSPDGLEAAQSNALEAALWAAVRALEESARIARRAAVNHPAGVGPKLLERSSTHERHAALIKRMLLEDGEAIVRKLA